MGKKYPKEFRDDVVRVARVGATPYAQIAEEEIALLRAGGCGVRQIARAVGRSPSTISRELRRNASTRSNELTYRASTAQWHAERRACRPKVAKLAADPRLRGYVAQYSYSCHRPQSKCRLWYAR